MASAAKCSICEEVFAPDQEVRATLCGHVFHARCLYNWHLESPTCPQCGMPGKQRIMIFLAFEEPSIEEENLELKLKVAECLSQATQLIQKILEAIDGQLGQLENQYEWLVDFQLGNLEESVLRTTILHQMVEQSERRNAIFESLLHRSAVILEEYQALMDRAQLEQPLSDEGDFFDAEAANE